MEPEIFYSQSHFKKEMAKHIFILFTQIELCLNFFEKPSDILQSIPDLKHSTIIESLTECVDNMFYSMGDLFDDIRISTEETEVEHYDRIIKDYYILTSVNDSGFIEPRIDFSKTSLVLLWSMIEDYFSVLTCVQFLMMPVELYVRFNLIHSKIENLTKMLNDYSEFLKFLLNILYKYRTKYEDKSASSVINLLLTKIKRIQNTTHVS